MKNNNFEDRYVSPEEIMEDVYEKFDDAEAHHERYHEFHIQSCVGYSAKGDTALNDVQNAIIVIKKGTDIINIRVVDGKVVVERPDEFYLLYKPEKYLVCALRQGDKDTFIKIKNGENFSVEDDITVYMMIHHEKGLFTLFFTPEEAKFTEPFIFGNDVEFATIAKSMMRFSRIPSNFRSLPKDREESEDDE